MPNNLQSSLRLLIAANKTNMALEELQKSLQGQDQSLLDSVTVQSSRWEQGKKQYNLGMITYEEWGRIQNQVNYGLLELISSLNENADLGQTANQAITNTINQNNFNSTLTNAARRTGDSTRGNNILFISANPRQQAVLRFGRETRAIKNALEEKLDARELFFFEETAVQPDEVLRMLKERQPRILHISMHNDQNEGLYFEDINGNEYPISTSILSSFIDLINARQTVIECVILNACNSTEHARVVSKYVHCAIGMSDFLPDDAAVVYSRGFYDFIALGSSYEEAHRAGVSQLEVLAPRLETGLATPLPQIPVIFSVRESQ